MQRRLPDCAQATFSSWIWKYRILWPGGRLLDNHAHVSKFRPAWLYRTLPQGCMDALVCDDQTAGYLTLQRDPACPIVVHEP